MPDQLSIENQNWIGHQEEIQTFYSKLKAEDSDPKWSAPFVPWCGKAYWDSNPRILFVGKSFGATERSKVTKEHPDGPWRKTLEEWKNGEADQVKALNDYVEQNLRRLQPKGPAFWTIPFLIAGALLPLNTDCLIERIAWSNLYKVDEIVDPPKKRGTTGQRSKEPKKIFRVPSSDSCGAPLAQKCSEPGCIHCKSSDWLRKEIEILDPDVLLLGVGASWKFLGPRWEAFAGIKTGFPIPITDEIKKLVPNMKRLKSAWLTSHFSAWQWKCQHGEVLLRIRKHLEKSRLKPSFVV